MAYGLTKIDVAALRSCDRLTVRYDGTAETPARVTLTKKFPVTERNPWEREEVHILSAGVTVDGQYAPSREVQCFAHINVYHEQAEHVSSVLRTLRVGDGVAFHFYPDAGTTQALATAGFHADRLELHVYRKSERHATFTLDSLTCSERSMVRMCRGIPTPAWLTKAIAEG